MNQEVMATRHSSMRIGIFLLLASGFAAAEAMAQSALMEELARARSKWESQRIENYAFVIANACVCPNPLHAGPLLVVVEEGRVRRALYLGERRSGYSRGQAVRKRTPLRLSVSGLFEMIDKRLKSGNPAHFKIKYDDKIGYPLQFEYDDPAQKNEEIRIQVRDFKRLK
jgi:hypothetical protein